MFLDKLARVILWVSGFVVGVCGVTLLIYTWSQMPKEVTVFVVIISVILWAITRVMNADIYK